MTDLARAAQLWMPGPQVFPVMKGRVALYAILKAAGVGPGDEVLVPGYTCVVVAAAVGYTGARPVFYDIDPATYNGDPDLAAALIGPRTRAVLVQHTFGAPAALGPLPDLCRERGILLVEDCAHAMGADTADGAVGELGDAAFASFQWSKPVSTGLGGAARVNDPDLAAAVGDLIARDLAEPSIVKSLALLTLSTAYNQWFRPSLFWPARAVYRWLGRTGVVAGSSSPVELLDPAMPVDYAQRFGRHRSGQIGRVLASLPAVIAHRQHVAAIYLHWCEQNGVRPQQGRPGAVSAHLRFPLLVRDRDRFLAAARARRIEIGDWFSAPLHPVEARGEAFGYSPGLCPVADRFATMTVNLPTHQHVTDDTARRVLEFVSEHRALVVDDPRDLGERASGGRA